MDFVVDTPFLLHQPVSNIQAKNNFIQSNFILQKENTYIHHHQHHCQSLKLNVIIKRFKK